MHCRLNCPSTTSVLNIRSSVPGVMGCGRGSGSSSSPFRGLVGGDGAASKYRWRASGSHGNSSSRTVTRWVDRPGLGVPTVA
eukprot:scaffold85058_cov18-Phaeocystis_antarctica.AAC.1